MVIDYCCNNIVMMIILVDNNIMICYGVINHKGQCYWKLETNIWLEIIIKQK